MANPKLSIILSARDEMTANIDKARKSLENIKNSGASARQQLRALQQNMAELNSVGLGTSSVLTEMAQYAGNLADAIGDAKRAVNAYANDQFKLQAGIDAMNLGVVAGTTFASTLDMLGIKNNEVAEAIKKAQQALTMLNGIQQVANILNKDSTLMLRIKQIQLKLNAATTVQDTAATTGNTVATGANTVATKIADSARKKLNTTMAIGKALMGDWTGLLLVGGAALTSYAIFAGGAKDKNNDLESSISNAKDTMQAFKDKVADSTGAAIGKFEALRLQWISLKDTASKTRWIKDNQSAFSSLGMSVDSLTAAENAFVNNTSNVVKALEARAKAAAAQQAITDAYTDYWKNKDKTSTFKAGDKLDKDNPFFAELNDSKHSSSMFQLSKMSTEYYLTPAGAEKANRLMQAQLKHDLDKTVKQMTAEMLSANEEFYSLDTGNLFKKIESSPKSSTKKSPKEKKTKEAEVFDPSSIKYARQMLSKVREEYERAAEGMEKDGLKNVVKYWEDELKRREGKVEVKPEIPAGSLQDLQNQLKEITDKLHLVNPENLEEIESLKTRFKELNDQILEMEENLGLRDVMEEANDNLEKACGSVGHLGSAFSQLGGAIGGAGGEMTAFVGNAISTIAQLIPEIVKLIAVNEAEAMSGAVASGAGIGFPQNLAAIAAGVAAVVSIFASLPKFESGGIVGGNSFAGDRLLVRANSGEMILNRRQQNNLFNALDNGNVGNPGIAGNVRFTIDGDKLVGVLSNYNSRMRKQS